MSAIQDVYRRLSKISSQPPVPGGVAIPEMTEADFKLAGQIIRSFNDDGYYGGMYLLEKTSVDQAHSVLTKLETLYARLQQAGKKMSRRPI